MKNRMIALMLGAGAMLTAMVLVASDADARAGRGGSAGSRGSNTFSAPPTTTTAPKPAAPIDKTITQPGRQTVAPGAPRAGSATAAQTSRFGGLGGILMGGLIGFALASLLGPGVLASVLGSILWFALIAGVIFLAVSFFRSRAGGQPALATASAAAGAAAARDSVVPRTGSGFGGASGLAIVEADYNAFERLLGDIQLAYGRGDIDALSRMTTPEMLSYFAKELDENAKSGVRNELSNVKLLQGDLAEAWREPGGEYATVAMRYSIIDAFVELKTGRVYSGSRTEPQEVTEIWTFYRPVGADATKWELSAIQQTG